MATRIGERFGNYQLVRLLGEGGFAEVYLGKHIHLASLAAIKILHSQLVDHEQEEFLLEARLIASLDHPSIVRVLDCAIEHNTPFLIMNYASHGTLRQRHPKGTQLPLAQVVSYVQQVASALQYAHERRVIHRDIKPENMLLGSHDEVLLSDFGIAMISGSSSSQSTKAAAGTVSYMAPEQIMGKPRLASDQYALGVVVYEWLCGVRPFTGSFAEQCAQHLYATPPSMRAKNQQITPEVEAVVLRALAKEPQHRFATVRDFLYALQRAGQFSSSHTALTYLSPTGEDASSIRSLASDDLTFIKAPSADGLTARTPSADLTVISSQHDAATFVKLAPELSSQQSLHSLTAQHTPVLSAEFKSETLSQLKTLLGGSPSQEGGTANTGSEKIGPAAMPVQGIANVEVSTKQRRGRSWLLIGLAVLLAFALITGSFVFAQLPAHPVSNSTNNTGAVAQLPTTTSTVGGTPAKNLVGKVSPTATLKQTPIAGTTATVNTLPNAAATVTPDITVTSPRPTPTPTATATATPSPTAVPVPPTLSASPTSILVENSSNGCTVETHGGAATGVTCNLMLSNTAQTTSTLNWSASMSPADYTISPASGSIAPGNSVTITFYNNSSVPCPTTETLSIQGSANTVQVPIVCTHLSISPLTLDSSNCTQNGNWTCVVTLSAAGDTTNMSWQLAAQTPAGVTFSQTSGVLAPGASVQITITIASTECPGYNTFSLSGGSLYDISNYSNWSC